MRKKSKKPSDQEASRASSVLSSNGTHQKGGQAHQRRVGRRGAAATGSVDDALVRAPSLWQPILVNRLLPIAKRKLKEDGLRAFHVMNKNSLLQFKENKRTVYRGGTQFREAID